MRGPPKRSEKDRHYYWIAALLVVITVATITAVALLPSDEVLAADLCPVSGANGHTTLLIDATDPFTYTQQRAVQQLVTQMAEPAKTPQGTLLTVYVFGESVPSSAEPLFERCSPGRGDDKSEMTHNLKLWKQRFEREFHQPLDEMVKRMPPQAAAAKSPILQMLQIVGLNFKKRNAKGHLRLIVVSDLLQNTAELSLYRELPDYAVFRTRPEMQRLRADLGGVTVQAHMLMNTPQLQNRRLLKFWEDYFGDMGARLPTVQLLPG